MITGIVVALLLAVIVFQYMIIKIDKDKRHEAGHDKLTGLCNPEHLMQKMKELPDKKKNRLIIYSDIAEFKLINEIFGIEKGNEILLKQADIIKKHAVDGYLYGRVGEDHFVVIADEATFNEEYGVYEIDDVVLSMPVIVGADGIESDIPINLSGEEAFLVHFVRNTDSYMRNPRRRKIHSRLSVIVFAPLICF